MSKDKIRESLERIVKELLPMPAALQAIVLSVNSDEATCKVKLVNSELELPAVRLRAITDSSTNGLVIKPEVNSKIIIGFVNGNIAEPYMISASIIESMYFRSEELGGLIKIEELKTQIDKNSKALQIILDFMTGEPVNEPGNGNPSTLQLMLGIELQGKEVADLSEIENTKVKHG